MIETLNLWSIAWSAWMLTALVEGTVLFALAGLVWLFVARRASAQFGYLLFLLVLARLALPLTISVPERWAWLSPQYVAAQAGSWLHADDKPQSNPPRHGAANTNEPLDRELATEAFATHADLLPAAEPMTTSVANQEPAEVLSSAAVLMIAWIVIAAALLARLAWVHAKWRRRLADAKEIEVSALPLDAADLLRRMRIRRRIPIVESAALDSPAVWGLLRPRLIVPPGLSRRLSSEQLAWVLAHEFAHVRRGDLWVMLAQRCLQIAYFFHPAVWLANRMIDRQREYACDDLALAASQSRGRDCAGALVAVAEWACGRPPRPALGLFSSPSVLKLRVKRLIATQSAASARLSPVSLALLLAAAAMLLPHLRAAERGVGPQGTRTAAAPQDAEEKTATAKPKPAPAEPPEEAVPATERTAAPSLEARAAAIAAIHKAHGRLYPDYEKLEAAGQRVDPRNPRNEFLIASFGPDKAVDDALANLAQFPELATVDLSRTQVTAAGLRHVGRLKNVTTLLLYVTPTNDEGLSHLVGMEKLQTLDLSKTKVTSRGMQWLTGLKELESLRINDTAVGDEGLKALAEINQLKIVELKNTQVTDAGLAFLADAPHLMGLWLSGDRFTDAGLRHLRRLSDLQWLDLTGAPISDAVLQQLDPQRKLKLLYIRDSQISDASAEWLAERRDLTELVLGNTALTDAGLAKLAALTQLEFLSLAGTEITDAGLETLAKCDKLRILRLGDTAVSDVGMAHLARLKALENLDLSGTEITPAGLPPLKALPRLAKIFVRDTGLTNFDVYQILSQANPNVQRILEALDGNTEFEFVDQPLSDVLEYLKERHNIEVQLDHKSFKAAKKNPELPVTMNLRGKSLHDMLNQLLDEHDLAMAIRHEALMIYAKPLPKVQPAIPMMPDGEQLSRKLRETLGEKAELEFVDTPLTDVIDYLSQQHNVEIVLDNAALLRSGIGSDISVTLNVKGIMLKSGLELVLGQHGLTCYAEGDRLVVRPIP